MISKAIKALITIRLRMMMVGLIGGTVIGTIAE
jgi:hypothetical protein